MRITALFITTCFLLMKEAPALTQSLVEVRYVDIPSDQIHEIEHSRLPDSLVEEYSAKSTASAILSITDEAPGRINGIVEWIYPTEHEPNETLGIIGGTIHPGGLPRSTVTPTAFQTRHIGTELELDRYDETTLTANLTDCLGLENSALEGGDPIVFPRFFSRRDSVNLRSLNQKDQWLIISTRKHPSDDRLLTLTCVRELSAPEEITTADFDDGLTIQTLIETFEIEPASLVRFLKSVDSSTDHTLSRALIDKMLQSGQARTLSTQWLTQPSGKIMKQSSALEYIYPTEMDPPELPNEIHGDFVDGSDLATGLSPTAFETRDCGTHIEIMSEVDLSSGFCVSTLDYSTTHLDIHLQIGTGLAKVYFPFFRVVSCKSYVVSQLGKPQLVAVVTPPARTSHLGKTHTESAVDAPVYQTKGAPLTVIFLTSGYPSATK